MWHFPDRRPVIVSTTDSGTLPSSLDKKPATAHRETGRRIQISLLSSRSTIGQASAFLSILSKGMSLKYFVEFEPARGMDYVASSTSSIGTLPITRPCNRGSSTSHTIAIDNHNQTTSHLGCVVHTSECPPPCPRRSHHWPP